MLADVPAAQLAASLPWTRARGSAVPPHDHGRTHPGGASSAGHRARAALPQQQAQADGTMTGST
ncbi:MAG TPA: hypothetical protein VIY52_31150 [Streptosporangiaceae bacterium]